MAVNQRRIEVGLGDRSYQIVIGSGLDAGREARQALGNRTDIMVVTNDTVGPLYLDATVKSLEAAGFKAKSCVLKDGEKYKTAESWMQILTALLEAGFGRDCAVAALGGGVVGDMAGFAAACYQRGVPFIQLPTTLLAMVDSSVGGKTAINHPLGKNMIGAFHQPKVVVAELPTLKTLPPREIAAGMGEIIKTAAICDTEFFSYLEQNCSKAFEHDGEVLSHIIGRCCEVKADVVSRDEREGGIRAILNFGHTFGHALEAFLGFGTWLHGEGVGLGMVIASALSERRGYITHEQFERVKSLVKACRLPTEIPEAMGPDDFIRLMRHDKKVRHGTIRYVLLKHFGEAAVYDDVSDEEVTSLITSMKEAQRG
jgi:3-dehydroquinate synthase